MIVAGADVGGTNIEVGLVGADHRVRDRTKAAAPDDGPRAVLDTIVALVRSRDGAPVAVGVRIPGVVHAVEPWLLTPNPELSVAVAALGDDAGVIGAAALGRACVAAGRAA